MLTKQETLSGRGAWVESRRVKETRKAALPCGLHSRVFLVMGLVSSCLWPITVIQGPSWWRTHCSTKMDSSEEDSGMLAGHVVSLFDLSRILLVGRGLLVLCF